MPIIPPAKSFQAHKGDWVLIGSTSASTGTCMCWIISPAMQFTGNNTGVGSSTWFSCQASYPVTGTGWYYA